MKFLILTSIVAALATAAPQGYRLPNPTGSTLSTGPGQSSGSGSLNINQQILGGGISTSVGGSGSGFISRTGVSSGAGQVVGGGISTSSGHGGVISTSGHAGGLGGVSTGVIGVEGGLLDGCPEGHIRHIDGSCVVPVVNRKVFVFDVPQQTEPVGLPPSVPLPKVDHNILFVRLPEGGTGPEPIIVPPPRQENIVYVLNKQDEQGQRVIEVPAHPPTEPEIYFVNYGEGENPVLPIGVDLNTALGSAAATNGQVIGLTGGAGLVSVGGEAGGATGLGGVAGGFGGATGLGGGAGEFGGATGLGVGAGGFGGATGLGVGAGGFGGATGLGGAGGFGGATLIGGAGAGFGGATAGSFGVGGTTGGLYTTP